MAAFAPKYFLDGDGCKLVFYFHRVARWVSLSTTCLPGGSQPSSVAPVALRGREKLRIRILEYIDFCCSFCWILNHRVNIHVATKVWPKQQQKYVWKKYLNTVLGPLQSYTLTACRHSIFDRLCVWFPWPVAPSSPSAQAQAGPKILTEPHPLPETFPQGQSHSGHPDLCEHFYFILSPPCWLSV